MNRNEIVKIISDVDAFENLCNKFNINDGSLLPDGFDEYLDFSKKHIGNQLLKMSQNLNLDQKDFDGVVYATVYSAILRSFLNNNSAEIMLMNIALFRLFFDNVMFGKLINDDGMTTPNITPAELYECKKFLQDLLDSFDMTETTSSVKCLTVDILSRIEEEFYQGKEQQDIKSLIEIVKALDVIVNKLNVVGWKENNKK